MNIEQGKRTDEEMINFINEYEYDDDDTYFYIRQFSFEWFEFMQEQSVLTDGLFFFWRARHYFLLIVSVLGVK